eukprot:3587462-Prymnesium_polylepis.1
MCVSSARNECPNTLGIVDCSEVDCSEVGRAALSAALCTTIHAPPPSHAYVYLQEDIADATVAVERAADNLASTAYPIIRSLHAPAIFSSLESSVANIVRNAAPDQ